MKDGRALFVRCNFTDNTASSGGAVYSRGGEAHFQSCRFERNTAQLNGGAVTLNGGQLSFRSCVFSGNVAINK
ncbi:hypothetical protein GUITHDRAFT_153046 [Guillardia theta CCMP2712]|uniref:Right handed beta helix domain-containing protein n=1 Tax=Guillardia theta (strain CCMP2712) TaxID=905079 RepID=L1J7L7_GUITC|nr:hypothetical protein GUITHDRAFT_153046 [Guillardia theta CCMP2712]EKX44080.1 hypothetical protein GUITHDRAFT_153046 [Guillardia theta CCMP2712]|eukprot:XP_005831060.1 hypothetical protein GUITHDRAFT_153046 [Guillardia theta CCMP2712]